MLEDWQERFPNCEPVGHWLRVAFHDRWVRFHSLPESKRYPEDESEYETVLERHNCILGELTGTERRTILLTAGYSEDLVAVRNPGFAVLDPSAKQWRSVVTREFDGSSSAPGYWHVFASVWDWRPKAFDPIVRLIADCTVANVMIVAPDCRWLLHPYDGGMDVIAESPSSRDRLKAAHKEWLSVYDNGM